MSIDLKAATLPSSPRALVNDINNARDYNGINSAEVSRVQSQRKPSTGHGSVEVSDIVKKKITMENEKIQNFINQIPQKNRSRAEHTWSQSLSDLPALGETTAMAEPEPSYYRDEEKEGRPLNYKEDNEIGESLDEFEGENEPGFENYDNETENFEMDSASNSTTLVDQAAVLNQKNATVYNFSTGEFGVVFSEPADDDDNAGTYDDTEDTLTYNGDINNGAGYLESGSESNKKKVVVLSTDSSSNTKSDPPTLMHFTEHSSATHNSLSTAASTAPKHEMMFASLKRLANQSDPHCNLSTHFKSWEKGVVTQLGTPIKRDCGKLRVHSHREVNKVKAQVKDWKKSKPWEVFALKYKHKSCKEIREDFENNFYVSELEHNFPIAYIFVVYTNAGQIIRLLKSIYRPHNLYCIHPDKKKGNAFADFFKGIAKCLDNVFVVSRPISVHYAHHSIMDAQLNCMKDLVHYTNTRWRYVINLCGREIPLKTNRELVESLQKLKGYTALDLHHLTPMWWHSRFRFQFHLDRTGHIRQTRRRQKRPPKGIKLYKSMNFIAASRAFVQFMLNDRLSQALRNYLKTVYAPEEHYYSSLYALSNAKGAKPPNGVVKHNDMPVIDNFIWITNRWQTKKSSFYCPGRKVVHGICILTTPDLERIDKLGIRTKQPNFFFNKYFLEWDPTPMDCMEEKLVSTNIEEYRRDCVVATHNHL